MELSTKEYDEKVREMQQYIPLLVQLIAKLETNQDGRGDGKESQLSKMRMLHRLLTKKENKLKLETLYKCEAVLQKIAKKLGKTQNSSDGKKFHDSFNFDDLSAPASPQERDNCSQFHSPIVIPTERRNSPKRNDKEIQRICNSDTNSNDSVTELFRRRSPIRRDHPKASSSAEDGSYFRRSPVSKNDSYSERYRNPDRPDKGNFFERRPRSNSPNFDKWKNKSGHDDSRSSSSPALDQLKAKLEPKRVPTPLSEVLRSPPLSATDIVDLLNESESEEKKEVNAMDKLNAVRKKLHNEIINSKKMAQETPAKQLNDTPAPAKSEFKSIQRNNLTEIVPTHCFKLQPSTRDNYSENQTGGNRPNSNYSTHESFEKTQGPADPRDPRDSRGSRDPRDSRNPWDSGNPRDPRDNRDPRDTRDPRETRDPWETRDPRETRSPWETRDPRDSRDPRESRDTRDPRNPWDARERTDKAETPNVRLAYKYNPHPRKHSEPVKNDEPPLSPLSNNAPLNKPSINTLPGVNLADPRLKNRPMNFMMPDKTRPAPNQMDMKMPAFANTDNRRPLPGHPMFSGFGGYNRPMTPQPVPPPIIPSDMIHHVNQHNTSPFPIQAVPSQTANIMVQRQPNRPQHQNMQNMQNMMPVNVNHHPLGASMAYNKFQPAINDQVERMKYLESKKCKAEPKTYGEYKQAKLAEKKLKVEPKSNEASQAAIEQKPAVEAAPSCLDKVYRTSNFNLETPSIGSFKIPKIKKEVEGSTDKPNQDDPKVIKDPAAVVETKKEKTPKEEPLAVVETKKEMISKEAKKDMTSKETTKEEETPAVVEIKKEKINKAEIKKEKKTAKVEAKKEKTLKIEPTAQEEPPIEVQKVPLKIEVVEAKEKSKKVNKRKKERKKKIKAPEKPHENEISKEEICESSPEKEIDVQEDLKTDDDVDVENNVETSEDDGIGEKDPMDVFSKKGARGRRPPFIVTSTTDSCEVSTQNILSGKRRTRSSLPAQSETTPSKEKDKQVVQNKRKTLPAPVLEIESDEKETVESTPRRGKSRRGRRLKSENEDVVNSEIEEKYEDCVVSSTTAGSNEELQNTTSGNEGKTDKVESKKEEGNEWLEGFLSNITNPALNKKETVLNILEKVLDEEKLKQIKEILDNNHDGPTKEQDKETSVQTPAQGEEESSVAAVKPAEPKEHHKKKKTELDRLNEDIRDMFISQGVLTATGKRMCTILTEEKKNDEVPATSKTPEPVKAVPAKKLPAKKAPVKRLRRKGKKAAGGAKRGRKPKKTPELVLEDDIVSEEDPNDYSPVREVVDLPPPVLTPQVKKDKNKKYKPCPKSKRKFFVDSDESDEVSSECEPEIIFEIQTDPNIERAEEQAEIIEEEKSDYLENISDDSMENYVSSFKNTNEEWHVKSGAAGKCVICSFAGEKMGNHYIRSHPEVEFPIARLPPHTLKSLKEGSSSVIARKNGSGWQHHCLFCNLNKSLSQRDWMDHFSSHTGEYSYKCSECEKRFDESDSVVYHVKQQCPEGRVIYAAPYECEKSQVSAHVCDLCGYIQLNRNTILNHLKSQHNEVNEVITKVALMICEEPPNEKGTDDPNFIKSIIGTAKRPSLSIVDKLSKKLKKTSEKTDDEDVLEVVSANNASDVVLIDDTDEEIEKDAKTSKVPETQPTIELVPAPPDISGTPSNNMSLVSMADRLCQRFSNAKSPADLEQDSVGSNHLSLSDSHMQRFTTSMEDDDQGGEAESVVYVVQIVNDQIGKEGNVKEAQAIKLPRTATLSEMLSQRLMKDSQKSTLLQAPEANSILDENFEIEQSAKSDLMLSENSSIIKTPPKAIAESQSTSWAGMSLVERLSQRLKSIDGNSFDKESEPNSPQPPEDTSAVEPVKAKVNDDDVDSSFEGDLVIDESAECDEGAKADYAKADDARSITTISSVNTQNDGDGVVNDVQDVDEEVAEVQDDDNWEDIEVIGPESLSKDDAENVAKKNKAKKNELIFSAFSRLYKLATKDKGKKSHKSGKKSPETTQNKPKEGEKAQSDLNQTESEALSLSSSENQPNLSQTDRERSPKIQEVSNEADPLLPEIPMTEAPSDLMDSINLENVVDLSMPQNDLHDLSGLLDLPVTEDSSNMIIVLSDEGELTNETPDINNLPVTKPSETGQHNGGELSSTTTPLNTNGSSNGPQPIEDASGQGVSGPPDMQRIDNMGFSKTPEFKIKYHCLVESCTFLYSELPIGLETHFLMEHPNLLWEGYCYSCEAQVCCDEVMTLSREYKHMMDVHVNFKRSESKEPEDNTKRPFIKVRNLSDLLSVTPEPKSSSPLNVDEGVEPQENPKIEVAKQRILNNIPRPRWTTPLKVTITSKKSMEEVAVNEAAVTSPSSDIKISSVSSSVNQDLIHNVSSNCGGFLKIAEVVSLAKLPPVPKSDQENDKPTLPPAPKVIATKPQIVQITPNPKPPNSSLLNLSLNRGEQSKDRKSIPEAIQDKGSANNAARMLKPWRETASFKTREIVDELLKTQSLYSLFKCMGDNCSYTTNSIALMRTHIKNHSEVTDGGVGNLRECPYCSYNKSKFYVEHIMHAHGEDIFHCPYCFFRACVPYTVATHLNVYHKGLAKKVLTSKGKQKTLHEEIRNMAKLRTRNVRPMGCWDCNKSFFIIRNFTNHLLQHNTAKSTFTCWMCRGKVIKTGAEKHLLMMHGIAVYECIYCSYATNSMDQMRLHIADMHPSFLPYMCVRVAPDKNFDTTDETLESSTVLANLAEALGDIPLVKNPFSDMDLSKQDPSVVAALQPKENSAIADTFHLTFDILRTDNTERAEKFSQDDPPDPQGEPELVSRERMYHRILEAAKEMVDGTGIEPEDLYKCIKCGISTSGEKEFCLHIQQHIRASDTENLRCVCLRYSIRSWTSFEAHLRWHAPHHYFCYFCNHTGPTTSALSRHINDVHQKLGMVPIPLILGLKNKAKDFFVVAPRNTKQTVINQYAERLVRSWERKKAMTKKVFTPEEIDLLPRQAIFINEVHCQECNYRTKVRTNMFRHLQFHKQEIKVATVDPVNPVPCLNSNERHFDKMVNLACSSNVSKDGTKPVKDEPKLPEFIPSMRRYVCGVPNCTYLTISKNMLKWHLNALHSNEQTYVCPHCKVDVCKKSICLEKIFGHLRFHESRLHVCEECNYTHYKRFIVERHINEKHPGEQCEVALYTRLGTQTIKTNATSPAKTQSIEEEKKDHKWECGLCKIRKATSQQISTHVSRVHNVKHRYQCVHCDFGGLYVSIMRHMSEKHPTKVQEVKCMFYNVNDLTEKKSQVDHTTPIWRRDPARVKNIRGILMEDEEESRRNLRLNEDEHDDTSQPSTPHTAESIGGTPSASTKGFTSIKKFSGVIPEEGGNDSRKEFRLSKDKKQLIVQSHKQIKTYGKPLMEHQISEKFESFISCPQCAFFATNSEEYQHHLKNFDHEKLAQETANFSFLCFHCTFISNKVLEVKQHWNEKHRDQQDQLPFWFQLVPKVACGRCNFRHEIRSVTKHHESAHPDTPLAVVNYFNKKMCGQCFYLYADLDDLSKHLQENHKLLKHSTFSVNKELLERLLLQGHSQRLRNMKCGRCNSILGAEKDFNHHSTTCHPRMPRSCVYVQDQVLYSCFLCTFVADEESVINHLNTHRFRYVYKCFTCQAVHKLFEEFADHLLKAHNTAPNHFTISRCINNKIKKLCEMNVIFPNGLVLKKSQLVDTDYGKIDLVTKSAKLEFAKYLKDSLKKIVVVSENKAVSNEEPPKSKAPLEDKNSKDVPTDIDKTENLPDTSKDSDSSNDASKNAQTSKNASKDAENEKISQSEIVKTSKGTKRKRPTPEKVDLSKIFTVMNFGGRQVPISCDRFAKLVKINVRVRIEKTNMSKYLKRCNQSPIRDSSGPSKKSKIN